MLRRPPRHAAPRTPPRRRKGSYLINASRGDIVVIEDFADALRTGHLAGGAADVFPTEPKKNGEGLFKSPLVGLPNVILTPHIGGSTEEAQAAIGMEVSIAMIKYINAGITYGAVNFPQVPQQTQAAGLGDGRGTRWRAGRGVPSPAQRSGAWRPSADPHAHRSPRCPPSVIRRPAHAQSPARSLPLTLFSHATLPCWRESTPIAGLSPPSACRQVDIIPRPGTHRLLSCHKNVPGVLMKINMALAESGCNIFAQQLATSDHVGYMVVDVNTAASEASMATIQSLEENIRTRMLW